jgi:hypothetical protein
VFHRCDALMNPNYSETFSQVGREGYYNLMCLTAYTRTYLRAGMKKRALELAAELYNLIEKIPLSATTYHALILCLTTICETHYYLSQQYQFERDLQYGFLRICL